MLEMDDLGAQVGTFGYHCAATASGEPTSREA
jgi:hypothetical protein